jgi:transposase
MSKITRRKFTPEFKSKVCLEVIKEHQTVEVISKKYSLHPTVVNNWKREFLKNSPVVFEKESSNTQDDKDQLIQMLYAQIGELKVANDFLKKKLF